MGNDFDAAKHGLPFRNGTFKFKVGPVSCSVLCGGISYTALDYYYTGIKPPQLAKTPAEGNPMETYLYRRQTTAHFYTWHRFLNAWSVSQIPILDNLGEQDKLSDLANHLQTRPVIICLYGAPFCGHHVVASGCDIVNNQIFLYDSNHPGVTSSLILRKGGEWYHDKSGAEWKGWFMDWGHYTHGTRVPPLAFRFCRRCHGLNTSSLGVEGACIDGAPHDNHAMFEYFLPWQSDVGQGGWTVCGKCQGIYRQTGDDVPFCPSIGLHTPQVNNVNWKSLRVATNGPGETGWSRCGVCCSLFWNKGSIGKCPSGDKHMAAPGESYVVDNRTLN